MKVRWWGFWGGFWDFSGLEEIKMWI